MQTKFIWNPFSKFTENQLLIAGIISAIIGTYLAVQFGVVYDGVLDVHLYSKTNWQISILLNCIDIDCIFLLLFGLGKILYPKTRVIDVLNVALIYRIPIYLSTFVIDLSIIKQINQSIIKGEDLTQLNISNTDIFFFLLSGLITLLLLIYAVILLVNGFKTASNIKKSKNYFFFAIAIIIAEVLSKAIMNMINF